MQTLKLLGLALGCVLLLVLAGLVGLHITAPSNDIVAGELMPSAIEGSGGVPVNALPPEVTTICEKLPDGQYSPSCTLIEILALLPKKCDGKPSMTVIGNNYHKPTSLEEIYEMMPDKDPDCAILQNNTGILLPQR